MSGYKKNQSKEDLKSEFNMAVLDIHRIDDVLRRANDAMFACAKGRWDKYGIDLFTALEAFYLILRPLGSKDSRKYFDEFIKIMKKRIYVKYYRDRVTFELLQRLYSDLMDFRQMVGMGHRTINKTDYTDKWAIENIKAEDDKK